MVGVFVLIVMVQHIALSGLSNGQKHTTPMVAWQWLAARMGGGIGSDHELNAFDMKKECAWDLFADI